MSRQGSPHRDQPRVRQCGNRKPRSARSSVALLVLEREGAEQFFGEPALNLKDFMRTTRDGRGVVNVLDSTTLINSPRLYSTFLLWLLSQLFEELPGSRRSRQTENGLLL